MFEGLVLLDIGLHRLEVLASGLWNAGVLLLQSRQRLLHVSVGLVGKGGRGGFKRVGVG